MRFLDWFRPKASTAPRPFFAGEAAADRSADVTGRWEGSYVQSNVAHPIAADLAVTNGRLTGIMTDHETGSEQSVFEVALDAGLAPGADELIVERIRHVVPGATPGAPVRYVTQLPPESVLEGAVRGRVVSFCKTYQGEHFTGYRVGDRYVGAIIERHVVHYQGELNDAGTEIQGKWWIEPARGAGGRRAQGSFLLRRQAAPSERRSFSQDSP